MKKDCSSDVKCLYEYHNGSWCAGGRLYQRRGSASDGMFTDGGADDQTGDISEIANDTVAQAEEKAQEYQKLKEEADRAAAKKAAEEKARKAEEERVAHRQEIVDFAMQFEGNPYVYGGTAFTNGADCSGFMMSVFKEFGYELPRVAASQYESSQRKKKSVISR